MSLVRSKYPAPAAPGPLTRAALRVFGQSGDGGTIIRTPQELEAALRAGRDTPAGVAVNEDTAMRVAAVYACVDLLSKAVSSLPQSLYERTGPHAVLRAENHPVTSILERTPNAWMTPSDYKRLVVTWLLLRGNFYAYKLRAASTGKLLELLPIAPDRMEVTRGKGGEPVYKSRLADGRVVTYKPGDIHHVKGLSLDGLTGVSVISAAANSIGASIVAERFGSKLFRNGAKPGGVLKHPGTMSNEAAGRLKADIEAQISGDNAHRLLLLEEGLDFESIAMTAEEAQFIDTRKFSRSEIAMFFGVPPHLIGDVERGTSWGSGIEQQGLGFLTYTIGPLLKCIAEAEARDFLTTTEAPGYLVRFDTSELTRADFLTRQQGLQIMRANGALNPDEWRAVEGYNPRPDGKGGEYSAATAIQTAPAQAPAAAAKASK